MWFVFNVFQAACLSGMGDSDAARRPTFSFSISMLSLKLLVMVTHLSKDASLDLIMEALMGVVVKSTNQRRRVSVKTSSSEIIQSADANTPSPQQTAAYIAEMCADLVTMTKGANLPFLAHLLEMAQAEAEYAADCVI